MGREERGKGKKLNKHHVNVIQSFDLTLMAFAFCSALAFLLTLAELNLFNGRKERRKKNGKDGLGKFSFAPYQAREGKEVLFY